MSTKGECDVTAAQYVALTAAAKLGLAGEDALIWVDTQLRELRERELAKQKENHLAMVDSQNLIVDTITSIFFPIQSKKEKHQTKSPASLYEENEENAVTVQRAIARLKAAISDASSTARSFHELERETLNRRLKMEIEACRNLLPPALIRQAEETPGDAVDELREAISTLEEARSKIETAQMQQKRQEQQVIETLNMVRTQCSVVKEMLHETAGPQPGEFVERQREIESIVAAAQARLATNRDEARELANEARRVVRRLLEDVSAYLLDGWSNINGKVNHLLGTLTALKQMVEEAAVMEGVDPAELHSLTERIAKIYNEAQLIGQSSSLAVQRRLTILAERVELLKQDVFNVIGAYQQQAIAKTIAATLADLSFQSVTGGVPLVQDNGDMMRIVATQTGITAEGERDDKLVTFDISRKGKVVYDFSGYEGDTCVEEAERIFAALRVRGVYLLDPQTAKRLQEAYPQGIKHSILNQPQYYPQPVKNKAQPELAERIRAVLERMDYHHIQQRSVGGSIEFDAFNGSIGYHVILNPEGIMTVLKDADHNDISDDTSDPVVAEGQQVIDQLELEEAQEHEGDVSRKKSAKRFVDRRNKRLLEN